MNQFVLEAFTKRELIIYQRGYSRSFVHVRDAVRGIIMGLEAPEEKVRGQVFNLGTPDGNYTKDEIVGLVLKRMPETVVEYKDLTFGGDMRDITVSFKKIREVLGFETTLTVAEPTADRTITLPNQSGTIAMDGDALAYAIVFGG